MLSPKIINYATVLSDTAVPLFMPKLLTSFLFYVKIFAYDFFKSKSLTDIGGKNMEQSNKSPQRAPITMVDVIRMLTAKLKTIICIAVVACIVGASLGVVMTLSNQTFGTEISFYIVPADSSKALLPILNSESFAEKLLLEETGLPEKSECDADDYAAALEAIDNHNKARELKKSLKKELDLIPYSIAPIENHYLGLKQEYDKIYALLNTYKTAPSDEVAKDPNHSAKIAEYEEQLAVADKNLTEYLQNVYNPAISDKLAKEEEFAKAKRLVDDTRLISEELSEKVLSEWRKKEGVRHMMEAIMSSVDFKYAHNIDGKVAETAENQNAAFLIISVSVDNDRETADLIIDRIKAITPSFIEKSLERLMGSVEPKCRLISTFAHTEELNAGGLVKSTVVYAAVFTLVSIACTCALVVAKGSLPEDVFVSKNKKKK